ncbi:MAG: TolB family protein [Thermoleophilaceae bacterium]
MYRRFAVLGALFVVAFAAVLLGRPASEGLATTSGTNGLIVYAKEVSGHFQLFTIRPDGTGARQITRVAGDAVHPDWSPDGSRIVFEFDRQHGCSVAIVNADGSGLTDLTGTRNGCENQPAFTPDGQRVVFVRFDDKTEVESIQSMNLSGADLRLITGRKGTGRTDPNVSPDGKTITFVRLKKDHELQALFAVNSDGSGLRRLTPYRWEVAIKHDWAPNGRRIALTTNADFVRPRASANLVTIRPDGSGLKRLTNFTGGPQNGKNAFAGSYSPDGKQIVVRIEQRDKGGLAVIGRDGRNLRMLTKASKSKPRFIDWGTHAP